MATPEQKSSLEAAYAQLFRQRLAYQGVGPEVRAANAEVDVQQRTYDDARKVNPNV